MVVPPDEIGTQRGIELRGKEFINPIVISLKKSQAEMSSRHLGGRSRLKIQALEAFISMVNKTTLMDL